MQAWNQWGAAGYAAQAYQPPATGAAAAAVPGASAYPLGYQYYGAAPAMPAAAPDMAGYSPQQWSVMQQQHWQQWQQWQQQFQQWQQQYGDKYQESLNSMAAGAAATPAVPAAPVMPPDMAHPPPLPPAEKPLPPPPPEDTDPPQADAYRPGAAKLSETAVPDPYSAPPFMHTAGLGAPNPFSVPPPSVPPPPVQPPTVPPTTAPPPTGVPPPTMKPPPTEDYNKPSGPDYDTGGYHVKRPYDDDSYCQGSDHYTGSESNKKTRSDDYGNRGSGSGGYSYGGNRSGANEDRYQGRGGRWSQDNKPEKPEQTVRPPSKDNPDELSEAEKAFDVQFKQWEEQFNKWKEQNINHPDKTQYREYEAKWESWREQLLQRREQMRKKRESANKSAAAGDSGAGNFAQNKSNRNTGESPGRGGRGGRNRGNFFEGSRIQDDYRSNQDGPSKGGFGSQQDQKPMSDGQSSFGGSLGYGGGNDQGGGYRNTEQSGPSFNSQPSNQKVPPGGYSGSGMMGPPNNFGSQSGMAQEQNSNGPTVQDQSSGTGNTNKFNNPAVQQLSQISGFMGNSADSTTQLQSFQDKEDGASDKKGEGEASDDKTENKNQSDEGGKSSSGIPGLDLLSDEKAAAEKESDEEKAKVERELSIGHDKDERIENPPPGFIGPLPEPEQPSDNLTQETANLVQNPTNQPPNFGPGSQPDQGYGRGPNKPNYSITQGPPPFTGPPPFGGGGQGPPGFGGGPPVSQNFAPVTQAPPPFGMGAQIPPPTNQNFRPGNQGNSCFGQGNQGFPNFGSGNQGPGNMPGFSGPGNKGPGVFPNMGNQGPMNTQNFVYGSGNQGFGNQGPPNSQMFGSDKGPNMGQGFGPNTNNQGFGPNQGFRPNQVPPAFGNQAPGNQNFGNKPPNIPNQFGNQAPLNSQAFGNQSHLNPQAFGTQGPPPNPQNFGNKGLQGFGPNNQNFVGPNNQGPGFGHNNQGPNNAPGFGPMGPFGGPRPWQDNSMDNKGGWNQRDCGSTGPNSRDGFGNRDNFQGPRDNLRDNFSGARDAFPGSRDREGFLGSRDNNTGPRDNFQGPRDNFFGSKDRFQPPGRSDIGGPRGGFNSEGEFDRGAPQDFPPPREMMDKDFSGDFGGRGRARGRGGGSFVGWQRGGNSGRFSGDGDVPNRDPFNEEPEFPDGDRSGQPPIDNLPPSEGESNKWGRNESDEARDPWMDDATRNRRFMEPPPGKPWVNKDNPERPWLPSEDRFNQRFGGWGSRVRQDWDAKLEPATVVDYGHRPAVPDPINPVAPFSEPVQTFDYGHGASSRRSGGPEPPPTDSWRREEPNLRGNRDRDERFHRDRDWSRGNWDHDRDYTKRDNRWERDRGSRPDGDRDRDRDRDRERERDRERDRDRERERDRDDRPGRWEEDDRLRAGSGERWSRRDRERDRDGEKDRGNQLRARDAKKENRSQKLVETSGSTSSRTQRENVKNSHRTSPRKDPTNFPPPPDAPPPPTFTSPLPSSDQRAVLVEDLLCPPGRASRPGRLVIILRGPPGSGKTFVAKLIKDKEVEMGGSAPRILCLDDYFMVEMEKEDKDPETGRKITTKVMEYEYEAGMDKHYRSSLVKAFRKTVIDGYFPFIIVDCINDRVKHFEEMWSFAKQKGFQVYICEMDMDAGVCTKRNIHNRSEKDILDIIKNWEDTPKHYLKVDVRSLLQSIAITEVEMEDTTMDDGKENEDNEVADGSDRDKATDCQEGDEEVDNNAFISKWERMDPSGDKLDRLDGLARRRKMDDKPQTMEDWLQLTDDYDRRQTTPGKKRVRWADLEERREQEKMRAIGFVVGQTDWNRMTDPTFGEGALTQTKYI